MREIKELVNIFSVSNEVVNKIKIQEEEYEIRVLKERCFAHIYDEDMDEIKVILEIGNYFCFSDELFCAGTQEKLIDILTYSRGNQ